MSMHAKLVSVLLLASLPYAVAAVQPQLRCVIEPDMVADVGTPVIGIVHEIFIERGDTVQEGQILAQLSSDVERASVKTAQARAEMEADVRAAAANDELQRLKLVRTKELIKSNFVSQQILEQVRAEARVAEEKLAQAREQRHIARHELELAQAQLKLRSIRAPFAGVVADRFVNLGERVELQPMFRIAKIDSLKVEIVAPASLFGSVSDGMAVRVTPGLPNAAGIDARVVLVDQFVDAASNTFRVRAKFANGNGAVTSGLRCGAALQAIATARVIQPATLVGPIMAESHVQRDAGALPPERRAP